MKKNKEIYNLICRKIVNSKSYINYITQIMDDVYEEFKDLPASREELYVSALKNLPFIEAFSKNLIDKENEFNKMIFDSLEEEENIFIKITCRKFMETYFGNDNKEDLNEIDALFPLLEAIFGLDNLLDSVENPELLAKEFQELYNQDINYFYDFYFGLYYDCKGKKYDEIISNIREYGDNLKYYVANGIVNKIKEVQASNTGRFNEIDELSKNVIDILGDQSKVM